MILSLGPWYVGPRATERVVVPFGTSSKPKLVLDQKGARHLRFLACAIDGSFFFDGFEIDRTPMISGRCSVRNFLDLFPALDWPLVGPGSKLRITVHNPLDVGQMFAPAFKVQVYQL